MVEQVLVASIFKLLSSESKEVAMSFEDTVSSNLFFDLGGRGSYPVPIGCF